jgi:hypothetical protein
MVLYAISYEKDISNRPLRCPMDPFAILLTPIPKAEGRPRTHSLRDVLDAIPTFMCAVQLRILDDAQGGRGWLMNASPLQMAVEELPLGPL